MKPTFLIPLGALALAIALAAGGCPPTGNNGNDNAAANENANENAGNGNDNAAPAQTKFLTPTRSSNIALTSDNRRAVVVNRETNSVAVIAVRDAAGADIAESLAEIGVGDEPRFVALAPNDSVAYVTNTVSGTVSVIALTGSEAFTVTATIPVGAEPRGCAVTPNGTRLYVANHTAGTVSVINTATNTVIDTVATGGNPTAIGITNDGDDDDTDETVFVTRFYAELIAGGPGETFDNGKQAIVNSFTVASPATTLRSIALSPVSGAVVGFSGDRSSFCQQINANAANNTFCPDVTITDATNDALDSVPQGAYPNQLTSILIRGDRAFFPSIGAQPEPPLKFNVNFQALVHVVDTTGLEEVANEHHNLNAQIKLETQPAAAVANTVLTRLFGADLAAIDANADGSTVLVVSRGGNYAMRGSLGTDGKISLAAPNVVRFQTGNIPTGIVISGDGKRAYTNNEVNVSITAINLESNTVITRDIPTGAPPEPGTFEHGVLVGKLVFFTSLGVADDGIFESPVRDIVPLTFRGKASDNGWSSCSSCHPDGLADGVTWSFATGPRQTVPLDAFFAKDNPNDQKISNWSAVRGSVTDFNENSVAVQGGLGFAGTPPKGEVYNHGITQGASDALDAQTLWVQTVRPPIMPAPADANAATRGRDVFAANCASCHGGAKWTKSQVVYLDNPVFTAAPVAGSVARDPGIANTAAQIRSYTSGGQTITFMEIVGTFDATRPNEIRSNATASLGGIGFNVPSLLGIGYSAPYFHDGHAQTLETALAEHNLATGKIATVLNAQQQTDLIAFLKSIDGSTLPFRSQTDDFRDAISP